MWMWILIGINIVVKVHGFASNPFPQSCSSMSPEHVNRVTGELAQPQTTEPPFEIFYDHGEEGEPITGTEVVTSLLLEACLSL